uniref:Uncharacterized protein n=1 Tax=Heterorhabditis bacteriophora TaxID=37862 RepID=A0A1I7WST2_HETBA
MEVGPLDSSPMSLTAFTVWSVSETSRIEHVTPIGRRFSGSLRRNRSRRAEGRRGVIGHVYKSG